MYQKKYITEQLLLLIGLLIYFVHQYIAPIPLPWQWFAFFGMVVIVGVPHGTLDYLVDEQSNIGQNTPYSIKKFIVYYLGLVFLSALFWLVPIIAFIFFLFFSAYHFGETDINYLSIKGKHGLFLYFIYGLTVLGFILLMHLQEMREQIIFMDAFFIHWPKFYLFLFLHKSFIILSLLIVLISTYFIFYYRHRVSFSIWPIVQFLLLAFLTIRLPLLLSFTFYFAIWHSIISLKNITKYLNINRHNKISKLGFKNYLIPIFLTIFGTYIIYIVGKYLNSKIDWTFFLIVLLSVLTLPHLKVMHGMYSNTLKNNNDLA